MATHLQAGCTFILSALITCLRCCRSAEEEAVKALESFPGVSIINDRAANRFPTPLDASNMDNVYVGR